MYKFSTLLSLIFVSILFANESILLNMAKGNYSKASKAKSAKITTAKGREEFLLKARALYFAEKYEEAIKVYQKVLQASDSLEPSFTKSQFGMAQCYAKLNRFKEAEKYQQAALTQITSAAMKENVASQFYNEAQTVVDDESTITLSSANSLYDLAQSITKSGQLHEEIILSKGKAQLHKKDTTGAIQTFRILIDSFPQSQYYWDAFYLSAPLVSNMYSNWSSYILTTIERNAPSDSMRAEALLLKPTLYGFPNPKNSEDLYSGIDALNEFIQRYPSHEKVDEALFTIATSPLSKNIKRPNLADSLLNIYLKKGTSSERKIEVTFLKAQSLVLQLKYEEAISAFEKFIRENPFHKKTEAAHSAIENIYWNYADQEIEKEQWKQAISHYETYIRKYKEKERAAEAYYLKGIAQIELSNEKEAVANFDTLAIEHPSSAWFQKAELKRAELLLKKDPSSKVAHKILEEHPQLGTMRKLFHSWGDTSLSIEATSPFLSSEKVSLECNFQGLDSVEVAIFSIDEEQYFREKLLMNRISTIAIELCTPQEVKTYKPQFPKAKTPVSESITLPIKEPGIYLVRVSGGSLEAVTTVTVTDLQAVMKVGPHKTMLYVEDRKTGKKVANAKVILTDHKKFSEEGVTNKEGIYATNYKMPDNSRYTLQAFIKRGAQICWIDKGQFYKTRDKSVHAPSRVHSDKKIYNVIDTTVLTVIPPSKSCTLSVKDKNNRVVYHSIITPSQELVTEKIPPHRQKKGKYRVYINNKEQCSYRVGENSFVSKKKDYTLNLSLSDSVYHYGDTIRGTVNIKSSQGNDINKLPVTLHSQLGEAETQTDEKGNASFTIPVHSLNFKSTSLYLDAEIKPLKLSESKLIHYIENEFSLSLSSPADHDETKPVKLQLHLNRPVEKRKLFKATLHLFKREGTAEEKAFTQAVTIGEDTLSDITLKKFHPGKYRAAIQSRDSKGNRVFAEHFFTIISREEIDSSSLLVTLSDTLYTPNEKLRASIQTNKNKGYFLCSFETDSILSKHLIPVKKGINNIELPLPSGIVPNAAFSVTLFQDNSELKSFQQGITVSKELALTLQETKTPTAGDSLTLQIAVTNIKEKASNATLSVFVHENQWGAHTPDKFYEKLYKEQIHNISNYLYDTLRTNKMVGEKVKGLSIEYRHERTGYAAFEEIRKELTKEAKAEYAGIGYGTGRSSGFGGGAGGLSDLYDLSGMSDADSLNRISRKKRVNRQIKRLGDHFKEYWITTSIAEFSNIKTDEKGIATVTIAIPDSIKGGLHISAVAATSDGYMGSFADTLSIIEKDHEQTIPHSETLPKDKMVHYNVKIGSENQSNSVQSIEDLLETLPVYTPHERDLLNTILLSQRWKSGKKEEQISSLLALLHGPITGGKAKDKITKEITTLELIQRVDSLPSWINAKSYLEKHQSLVATSIKEEKSWYKSLRQMAFLAESAPTKLPLIKLQRADREQKKLSPRAKAALAKVWQNLNRSDKVNPLLAEIRKNLREEIEREKPNRDLLITSCEVLLKEKKSSPLLVEVMKFITENVLPSTLHNSDDLSRVASILADYYGDTEQGFFITKEVEAADTNSAITLQREFIAITKNFLGENLDPISAGGERSDTLDWQTDSLKKGDYVIVRVSVKSDSTYRLIEYIPHGFSLASNTFDNIPYDRKTNTLELQKDASHVYYYILQAQTEGPKEFVPATLMAEKLQRVGSIDTLHVISPQSKFVYPTSPYTLEEMGSIAYERGFPAIALPLLEEAREMGLESKMLFKDILFCAIESDDNEKIVSYFEQAKEINPNLLIPFEKIAPIQKAYKALDLYESGYLLAKGTTESRFIEEMNIIGSLESIAPAKSSYSKYSSSRSSKPKSNTKSSIETMKRVTAAYPHGSLHSRSLYLFSHLLYDRIDLFEKKSADELQEEKKRLLPIIEELLQHYLAEYQNPNSFDNARFTLAAASLDKGDNRKAINWTYAEQDPKNTMSHTVQSIRAYALFLEERFVEAEKICHDIMDNSEIDKASRDMATYILAQIYHGKGDMSNALSLYEKIADYFEDAQYIVAKSATKEIELPEIHSLSVNDNNLPVTLKNIDSVLIKTYPIDLVRFLEGSGSGSEMRKINLSGIKPLFTKNVTLPKRIGISQKRRFETGITKNGTYLTFVQSADTTLYSILVKGDITLSIDKVDYQTLHVSTEDKSGKPLSDVTLIIKDTDRLIYAKSDKRGVYKTDVLSASPVVIAKKGNSYGVYLKKSAQKKATFKKYKQKAVAKASPMQYMEKMRSSSTNSNNNFFNNEIQGVMLNQLEK